jgi:tRNA-2-methylthio-N6-dimethylallyladenosine synthase/ribosomal protein S12 methylthiotransferase
LGEARSLARAGCLELTLVAQDLASYAHGGKGLLDLARALDGVGGLRWIRLMYCHPGGLTKGLLRGLASLGKVAPYLDVPFQHASVPLLKAMGRGGRDPRRVVDLIRDSWPGVALRTTLITGFPGEGEGDFRAAEGFLESSLFQHAGFFSFSPEEGTRAASLPGQLPEAVREARRRRLAGVQRKITQSLNRRRVGQVLDFLPEGPSPESPLLVCGRASFQAPEVDGLVYFEGWQPKPGAMIKARVAKARGHDLLALPLGGPGGGGAGPGA